MPLDAARDVVIAVQVLKATPGCRPSPTRRDPACRAGPG
jgi:hypothetical protein